MRYKIHKIASTSPLLIDGNAGYDLIYKLSSIIKLGIYDFEIGDRCFFLREKEYRSEFIENCQTFAHYVNGGLTLTEEIFIDAWHAVIDAVRDLHSLSAIFLPHTMPRWKSLEEEALLLVNNFDSFHCGQCTAFLKDNIIKERLSRPHFYTTFCHGDLHSGNIILSKSGFKIIDLENIHPGPAYSDLFLFSILVPGADFYLDDAIRIVSTFAGRSNHLIDDFCHSLNIALILHGIANNQLQINIENSIHSTINRYLSIRV